MLIIFAALVAATAPRRSLYAILASTFGNRELPSIQPSSLAEKAPETFYKDRVSDRYRYKETVVAISNTLFEALMFRESETSRGGAILAEKCQVDLVSCLFTENSAPIGGALVLIDCHSAFVFTNFSRCEAEIDGGAMALVQGEATFDRVTIRNCRSEVIGGGVFAETVSMAIQNSTFYKNWAGNIGGGLYVKGQCDTKLTMTFFAMNSCSAMSTGGAIAAENSTVHCKHVFFEKNEAGTALSQKVPIMSLKSRIYIEESCLSNADQDAMVELEPNSTVIGSLVVYLAECPVPNVDIPEVQEEFKVRDTVSAGFAEPGFIFCISAIIGMPVVALATLSKLLPGFLREAL